jgi:peptidoglycan-N-acetylglucosamine deacetylase
MLTALFSLTVCFVFILLWFLLPFALRKWAEARLQAKCCKLRAIVLTYDDGPGSALTSKLLDLLEKENVRASFFVLGRNISGHEGVLARLLAAKHDIGSHTFDHSNAWKTLPWVAHADIKRGIQVVQSLGGDPHLFRPPFGKVTLAGLMLYRRLALHAAWWTTDSRDSWDRRPVADVISEIESKGGGVVLMHDFDNYQKAPQHPSHADYVLSLTSDIIALARRSNYEIIPYSMLNGSSLA